MTSSMHAWIISGGSPVDQLSAASALTTEWNVSLYDIVRIDTDGETISIEMIRSLIGRLQLSPGGSKLQVAIIDHADLLSIPAQQALLKVLEEPPSHSRIILCIGHQRELLPTIVSRCVFIRLSEGTTYSQEQLTSGQAMIHAAISMTIGQRLAWCQSVMKTKEETIQFLHLAIASLRHESISRRRISAVQYRPQVALLRALLDSMQLTNTNVNMAWVIERIFLGL